MLVTSPRSITESLFFIYKLYNHFFVCLSVSISQYSTIHPTHSPCGILTAYNCASCTSTGRHHWTPIITDQISNSARQHPRVGRCLIFSTTDIRGTPPLLEGHSPTSCFQIHFCFYSHTSLELQTFYKLNTPPQAILDNATMLSRTAKNSALLYCLRSQPVVSDFTTLNYRVTLLHI